MRVNALWEDWRDLLLEAVAAGDKTPAEVEHAFAMNSYITDYEITKARKMTDAALEAGGRRRCQNCRGKGTIPTPHTGADQTCVVCEGKGSVAKR